MRDQAGQGSVIVEDELRPQRFRRRLAVASGKQRQRNPCSLRRFRIDFTVPNEQRPSRAPRCQCRTQRGRIGFALGQGVAADDDGKMQRQPEMAQHCPGRTFWLVRAYGKPVSESGQV